MSRFLIPALFLVACGGSTASAPSKTAAHAPDEHEPVEMGEEADPDDVEADMDEVPPVPPVDPAAAEPTEAEDLEGALVDTAGAAD